MRIAFLTACLLLAAAVCPVPTRAADEKPAATPDLSKKFVVVNHIVGSEVQSSLLKKVEFRRLGDGEFLIGEYSVNAAMGVDKGWEGVQLYVPVKNIEAMMVFADEKKAWDVVKEHGKPKDDK